MPASGSVVTVEESLSSTHQENTALCTDHGSRNLSSC